MKPVAAGTAPERAHAPARFNPDALMLLEASGLPLPYETVNPYLFEPAIAPHIAAAEAGVVIEIPRIVQAYEAIAAVSDCVVVEGAGGWLVPLDAGHTMADVAAALNLPVLLVAGIRLGCLNHALMTAESVRARGLALAGWVANRVDPDSARYEENLAALEYRIPAPCIGIFDWAPGMSAQRLADSLDLDARNT